jgi:hypothetical protein
MATLKRRSEDACEASRIEARSQRRQVSDSRKLRA